MTYTCKLSKQQIIDTIAAEFYKANAEVTKNPTSKRAAYREEMLLDLLRLIPIEEHES